MSDHYSQESGDSMKDSDERATSTSSSASRTPTDETYSEPGSPESPSTRMYEVSLFNPYRTQIAPGEWVEGFKEDTVHDPPPKGPPLVLTSFAGDSPANHSASQDAEEEKAMNATSGPSSSESSASSPPATSSSKTCQASPATSPTLSRTTDAYAAGLIDGEGCLYIDRALIPCLDMGMAQSAMPLLAKLQATYGGSLKRFRPPTDKWQAGWTWRLSGKPCAETLELLSPMMRLKQRQARLLLELQALKDTTMLRPGGRTRWTPQTRERAEELRAEVKALNRRGPDADWEWPEKADAVLVGDRLLRPQTSLLSETGYEESSGTFPTSGLAWATGSLTAFSTHVSSECRSADGECSSSEPSLTEILEPPLSVPARYSLSARAASGILRRAEKRGRTLPSHLSQALEAVARTTTTDSKDG